MFKAERVTNVKYIAQLCPFLLSSPFNHLTTSQIYYVTLWSGPEPQVGNHWPELPNCR